MKNYKGLIILSIGQAIPSVVTAIVLLAGLASLDALFSNSDVMQILNLIGFKVDQIVKIIVGYVCIIAIIGVVKIVYAYLAKANQDKKAIKIAKNCALASLILILAPILILLFIITFIIPGGASLAGNYILLVFIMYGGMCLSEVAFMVFSEQILEVPSVGIKAVANEPGHVRREPAEGGKLFGLSGEYKGAEISLPANTEFRLGKDASSCQLVFSEASVSRNHVTITYNSSTHKYTVVDSSKNGTYVKTNGEYQRIKEPRIHLPKGTIIALGNKDQSFKLG